MTKLFVRLQLKSGVSSFFRCGIQFGPDWQKVEVDEATAARLQAEQMLEVSETEPAELESNAPNEADPSGGSTGGTGADTSADATVPTDPAERQVAIVAAIKRLDRADAALWTAGGKPKTEAIATLTGWPVSAAERDAAAEADGAGVQ